MKLRFTIRRLLLVQALLACILASFDDCYVQNGLFAKLRLTQRTVGVGFDNRGYVLYTWKQGQLMPSVCNVPIYFWK